MKLKRDFFKYLTGFLEEQGIKASEVLDAFSEERGLSVGSKRDLADLLREEGYAVTQPAPVEAKFRGQTAAERTAAQEPEVQSRAQAEEQGAEEKTVEFTANANARPADNTE